MVFILLAVLTPPAHAEVPFDPPGTHSTSWLGNTHMDAAGHKVVTEELTDLCVSPNGHVFSSGYAEAWGGGAEYNAADGSFIARYDRFESGFGDPTPIDPTSRTGSIYPLAASTKANTKPVAQWNTFEIACDGQDYTVRVNNEVPNTYPNIDEMLAGAKFDLLVNTTSMPSHYPVNKGSLEAPRNVWSEKPMALEVRLARELLDLANTNGVRIQAAPTCVTSPQFKFMAGLIASGKIGKVTAAHGTYGHNGPTWSGWFLRGILQVRLLACGWHRWTLSLDRQKSCPIA